MEKEININNELSRIARKMFAEKYCKFILDMKEPENMLGSYLRDIVQFVGTLEKFDYYNCEKIKQVFFKKSDVNATVSIIIEFGNKVTFTHHVDFPTFKQMMQYIAGYNDAFFNIRYLPDSRAKIIPQSKHYKKYQNQAPSRLVDKKQRGL
tara:strand:+ start:34 stop:486 length:453 start_codon:yes stop_codon:yes gene_type:complete